MSIIFGQVLDRDAVQVYFYGHDGKLFATHHYMHWGHALATLGDMLAVSTCTIRVFEV